MRVLTKLIYGIFSFNPCNSKKRYRYLKISSIVYERPLPIHYARLLLLQQ